jgi:hypothetical protein
MEKGKKIFSPHKKVRNFISQTDIFTFYSKRIAALYNFFKIPFLPFFHNVLKSSSRFIQRLCPKALSKGFIQRLYSKVLFKGFIQRLIQRLCPKAMSKGIIQGLLIGLRHKLNYWGANRANHI